MPKSRTKSEIQKDRRAVAELQQRKADGKKPTRVQENAAIRLKEDMVREGVTSCSANFFEWLTGLGAKQRIEWEDRYKIPCGKGRVGGINLLEVFTAIRKLIADHRLILNAEDGSASLTKTKTEKEIEKLEQQIRKLKNQSHQIEKSYVRVDVMRDRIIRMASHIKTLGDQFARKRKMTGPDAQKMLNNALKNFEREMERMDN